MNNDFFLKVEHNKLHSTLVFYGTRSFIDNDTKDRGVSQGHHHNHQLSLF